MAIDNRRVLDEDLEQISGGATIIRDGQASAEASKTQVVNNKLNEAYGSERTNSEYSNSYVQSNRFESGMLGNEVRVGKDIRIKNQKENFFTKLIRAIFG